MPKPLDKPTKIRTLVAMKRKSGFTLIELLVTITIVGMLVVGLILGIVFFLHGKKAANNSKPIPVDTRMELRHQGRYGLGHWYVIEDTKTGREIFYFRDAMVILPEATAEKE